MKRALWLSVVLSLAVPAAAEPFGELFPVTNTRYRTAIGAPRLVTNDRDFFLFWGAENKIRAARVEDGEARVSHTVLDTNEPFDVAWTGEHYVIVSTRTDPDRPNEFSTVVGRVLDAEAHPVGAEFTIAAPNAFMPRIAAGAHSIAVIYRVGFTETRVLLLSRNGRTIEMPGRAIGSDASTHAITRRGDGFLAVLGASNEAIRAVALDRHSQTVAENTFPLSTRAYLELAAGSDGTKSLAVWYHDSQIGAITIDENAEFGAPLELGRSGWPATSTVVWNGAAWTVSYAQDGHSTLSKAVIVQVHPDGHSVLAREESAVRNVEPTVAALDGRILAAWRPAGADRSPVVAALPLATPQPRAIPWVASRQTLLATASSDDATLLVWSETTDGELSIHAGVRDLEGQWNERRLATIPVFGARRILAASDGHGFAIALSGPAAPASLIRLDRHGRSSGEPITLPIRPEVMAWNGTNYALIDSGGSGILVSPDGVQSAVVNISMFFIPMAMASDGHGFFVAGDLPDCSLLCPEYPIHGVRLGPDLMRLDAEEYVLADDSATLAGLAWDGSRYVLIANSYEGSFVAYMPPAPSASVATKKILPNIHPEAMTALRDGTIALAGRDETNLRVAFMSTSGTILRTSDIEGVATTAPRLESLADGVALFSATVQNAAPHDGTSRIVTAIARSSSVTPPTAPHIGVRVKNGVMQVDWTAASGTVNGYRLEYRIDDDEWVEWEQWFGPGVQSKSIRQPSFGTQFAFRVRAFNDGGAGPYSATALTKPGRRRAVR